MLDLCAAALRSFHYLRDGETWNVREELLVVRAGYRLGREVDARPLNLLKIWEQSASTQQEEEIAIAVRLQSDLLKDWRNWDKAIAAFRCVPEPQFAPLRERLFAQWRKLVAERSIAGHVVYDEHGQLSQDPHWIHALADAAWEGETKLASFCAWLRQWLSGTEKDPKTLRHSQGVLARFCLDVDGAAWLSTISPNFGASFGQWPER